MTGIIVLVILVVIVVVLIGIYNSLVQLRVRADSAWSDIDVQLKRRHDLIPNLVETVKGYATHEKGTFENIAKYRSAAMSATTPADRAAAEGQLTGALKRLVGSGRKLSPAPGLGRVHCPAEPVEPDRRHHPEFPALLQCRGARPEHPHPDLSHQHSGRHVRLPDPPVLRAGLAGRSRERCREVLMSSTAQFVRRRSRLLTALLLSRDYFSPARLLARDWRITDFHTTSA